MEWFQALILGLVQGLTEFLPVSSSGHLVIGRELLGVEAPEDLTFEVVVHAATVLSTIVVFRKEIWGLLKGFFSFKSELQAKAINDETDYLLKIAVSMIPVFVVGVFFKDYIKEAFSSTLVVAIALTVTAMLLFFSDMAASGKGLIKIKPSQKEHRGGISYLQAFIIGLGQALAAMPGLSRSGTTISTGILSGVKKENVAQFSFLMVLIPILGESFLDIIGGEMGSSSTGIPALIIGFIAAFASGLFACKVMIALVKKARLSWFALYCAVVALLLLIFAC